MTVYIATFIILLIGAVIDFITDKPPRVLYFLFFVWLTVLLCCRYGTGSDYFAYQYIYVNCEWQGFLQPVASEYIHGEKGWLLLCAICHSLGIRYELFVAIIGLTDMTLLDRFIRRFCQKKVLALLIAYPTLYLTYYFSALRQGLFISLFLAFVLQELLNHRIPQYYAGVIILSFIHSAALLLLVVPLFEKIDLTIKKIVIYSLMAVIVGIIIAITPIHNYLPYADRGISIAAISERAISLFIVLAITSTYYGKEEWNRLTKIVNYYSLGALLYFVLLSSSLASSRLTAVFKVLEICIYSIVLRLEINKNTALTFTFVLLLTTTIFFKNIDSYIAQNGFPKETTVWTYRYYSIFDKREIVHNRTNDTYVQYLINNTLLQ